MYFLGWVPNAADRLLSSIDIFCQPSLWEANSIVLLEAMAAGIPIVGTDVGESGYIIDEGRNGLVVRPRDTAAMADALQALVSDPLRRQQMGHDAQLKFAENYTVDKMISNYCRIYENLL